VRASEIASDINNRYSSKKKFLLERWRQCKEENELVSKQRNYKKYTKMYLSYAFPLNQFVMNQAEQQAKQTI